MITPRRIGSASWLCCLLASSSAFAQSAAQTAGKAYLISKQASNGSFGTATGSPALITTEEVIAALATVPGAPPPAMASALSYIRSESTPELDLQARRLLLLDGTTLLDSLDASTFTLAALQNGYGFLTDDSWPSPLESARAIAFLAAHALRQNLTTPSMLSTQSVAGCPQTSVICSGISPYLTFLLSTQNTDGGWSFAGENSSTRLTAEILFVLMPLRGQLSIDTALTKAVTFLTTQQAADGHFGNATPSTAETGLAAMALAGAPTAQTAAIQKAITYLNGQQKADGSWDESELNTALALQGLAASAADLTLTPSATGTPGSVGVSSGETTPGATETVSVTINNTGATASAATTATIEAVGSNGQVTNLGTVNVPSIAAGGSTTVTDNVDTSTLKGKYRIVVVENGQSLSTSATQASQTVQVDTQIDLAVTETDIVFTPQTGGNVQIAATVHDYGQSVSTPFQVAIYLGNPLTGGTLLSQQTVNAIASNGTATVVTLWNPSVGNGPTPIYALADATNLIADSNPANNLAMRLYVAPVFSVDLSIAATDILISPLPTLLGQQIVVTLGVHNPSAHDVYRVPMSLRFGDNSNTFWGPRQMGTLDVVPAGGRNEIVFVPAMAPLGLPVGAPSATMEVEGAIDPFATLKDPVPSNNTAEITDQVGLGPSIVISSFGSTSSTMTPVTAGAPISLTASVSIIGTIPKNSRVPWVMTADATAGHGGTVIGTGLLERSNGGTLNVSTTALGPETQFVLTIDPDNLFHNTTPWLAQATFDYGAGRTDLAIAFNDVSLNPVGPDIGETTTVTAIVHNLGANNATSNLNVFVGDPSQFNPVYVGVFPIAVAAGQSTQVSFPWTRNTQETNLYFQLSGTVPIDTNYANDITARNAYLEAVYVGSIDSSGAAPFTSPPSVGDILRNGHPVIGFGDSTYDTTSKTGYTGHITMVQKAADNSLSTLWKKTVDNGVGTPVFVDLGGDGGVKIVFLSVTGTPNYATYGGRGNTIHVWNTDGTVFWEKSYVNLPDGGPSDSCVNEMNLSAPGVGDVNGDGVIDIVFPAPDGKVHVLDGLQGTAIWEQPFPKGYVCSMVIDGTQPAVLDLNGDGKREVVISGSAGWTNFGQTFIYSSTGTWLGLDGGEFEFPNSSSGYCGKSAMGIAPTGASGAPALVGSSANGEVREVDWATGNTLWSTSEALSPYFYHGSLVAADAMSTGLPLVARASTQGLSVLSPLGTELYVSLGQQPSAVTAYGNFPPEHVRSLAAADLLGLGGPQFVGVGSLGVTVFDGRTGKPLIQPLMKLQDWDNEDETGEFYEEAIADVDNDGHGEVVMNNFADGSDTQDGTSVPSGLTYGAQASLLIFGSDNHWKAMPTVWSGIDYHHQFNNNLTLSSDAYKPWTTHNTWRQQFVTNPSVSLPDLEIGTTATGPDLVVALGPDGGPLLAGQTTTVNVTVHNLGSAKASSSFPVALYLGDPSNGGTLLATNSIAGPVAAFTGSATTTFNWTAWPEALDQLTAVVNPAYPDGGRALLESGYENNQASTVAWVTQGTQLADLAVNGTDFGSGLGYAAGQPVTMEITVYNNGVANAGPFTVTVTDGTGGLGLPLGSFQLTGLKAGKSTVITVSNWLPRQGEHAVTLQVDPTHSVPDSNFGNNTAVVLLNIGQASMPDLAVSTADLSLSPAGTVNADAPLQLTSVIHNYGAAVSNVPVTITLDPGVNAVQLASTTLGFSLGTGDAVPLITAIKPSQLSGGQHIVQVQVDPLHHIAEYDESNNTAQITLNVAPPAASVAVTTDMASYLADTNVAVTVKLSGLNGVNGTYLLSGSIELPNGTAVAPFVSGWTESLGAGFVESLVFNWNDVQTPAGNYLAVATLTDPSSGLTVASGQASFVISPDVHTALATGPLLTSYAQGSSAVISTRVQDKSLNAALANANLTVTVKTPGGSTLYTLTRQRLNVPFSDDHTFLDTLPIPATAAAGSYPITATLTDSSNNSLATASGTLTVSAPTLATELSGTLTATPSAFSSGTSVSLVASLQNVSGAAIASQPVVVKVVNPSTQGLIQSYSSNQTWTSGQTVSITNTYDSTGLAVGDYLAAVIVNGVTIAHTVLYVDTAGTVPPLIVITGVYDGELTSQNVTPVITITAPSGTFTDTINLDGKAFVSGTAVSAAATHTLAVTATDSKSNTASATVVFTIYKTAPTITISGVFDGEYSKATSLTPTITVTDPYLDASKTVSTLNGSQFTSGTPITAEGTYTLAVSASDHAGQTTTASAKFYIDRTAPTVTIGGVTDGQITNAASVTPTVSVTDTHLDSTKTVIQLDGATFVSGTQVKTEADHVLTASGTDLAGNTTTKTVHFSIDRTAPTISVTGVANNTTYAGALNPAYSASDAHLKSVTATLDSASFISGALVTASGSHSLVVTATDKATNTATSTVTFTISPPSAAPKFSPGLCAASVTLTDSALVSPVSDAGQPMILNSSGALTGSGSVLMSASAIVAGNLSWTGNADLTGTLTLGGTKTIGASAIVGTVILDAGLSSPCCPFNVTTALTAASTNNDNTRLPAALTLLDIAGALTISSGSYTLPSGDYYFQSIALSKTAQLKVQTGAQVTLYVNGNLTTQDQAILTGDPQNLTSLTVIAGGNVTLGSGQITTSDAGITLIGAYLTNGLFYVGGAATLSQSSELVGALVAQSATLSLNSQLWVPPALVPANGQVTCQ